MEGQARQTMETIKRALEASGSSMDNVLKMTCYVTDLAEKRDFDDVYVTYFSFRATGEGMRPGREPWARRETRDRDDRGNPWLVLARTGAYCRASSVEVRIDRGEEGGMLRLESCPHSSGRLSLANSISERAPS